MKEISLRTGLIITFVTLGIISIICISTINAQISKTELEKSITKSLEELAESRTQYLFDSIQNQKNDVVLLAETSTSFLDLQEAEPDGEYRQIYNRVRERLLRTARGQIYEVTILDNTGKVVASSDESKTGEDESGEKYFLKGNQKEYTSEAYLSNEGIPTIAMSARIIDYDTNEPLGTLVEKINIEKMGPRLQSTTGLGETGELYILNSKRYNILPLRNLDIKPFQNQINTESTINCFKQQQGKQKVKITKDYRGEEVIGIYEHLPEMNWCLVIKIDKKEAYAAVMKTQKITFYTAIIFAILLLTATIIYSGHITKFLRKLTDNITQITKGNFKIQLQKSNVKEFKDLTESLNRILASLKLAVVKAGVKKEELGIGEAVKAKEAAEKISEKKTKQFERFAKLATGREDKMIELKKIINELEKKLGKKASFKIPTKKEAEKITRKYLETEEEGEKSHKKQGKSKIKKKASKKK